jgi:hypothetical protein
MPFFQCNVTLPADLRAEVFLPLNLIIGKGVSHADREEGV